MLDASDIAALTFDCYGTLVDWEAGILGAVGAVFRRHGVAAPAPGELLSLYAELEAEHEAEYRPYREVLARTMTGIAERYGVRLDAGEEHVLAETLAGWPVFPDTRPFLEAAGRKYTLCVCSNIDDDLWRGTQQALGARLDWVVTAEYCRSYKPDPRHFRVALALLDLPPSRVLHVAESRRHDIGPAKGLGFRTAWVNRHRGRPGPSASGAGDATPDLEVGSLKELAGVLGLKESRA